ncbi:helix-turn-helix domain-containing protein [Virgibacillus kekensis]|uniref:Helix-turn-helix domain-containing protein n=1 Tax=Virgibacillus kekensis TaxID=202261 RepID=A0ABV9DKM6_9BACI
MIGAVLKGEIEAKKWFVGPMKAKETAEYLNISLYKLRKMIKEDKIPYSRLWGTDRLLLFHKAILDAWKSGEFPSGSVELLLDDESIDFEHEEALGEHYKRYPELLEKKKVEKRINKPLAHSNISYTIKDGGVYLKIGDKNNMEITVCLSHAAIEEIHNDLKKYRNYD